MLQPITFTGSLPGPHLLVTGGVHGDEPCGMIAIEQIRSHLQTTTISHGTITLIAICNPRAAKQQKRHIDHDLNRICHHHPTPISYEQFLANELITHIAAADLMVDLHSMQHGSNAYLFQDIEDTQHTQLAQACRLRTIMHGRDQMLGKQGTTDTMEYARQHDTTAVLIECGQHDDPQAVALAYQAIRSVLICYGYLTAKRKPLPDQEHLQLLELVTKKKAGRLAQPRSDGETIPAHRPIAQYDDGETITRDHPVTIVLPKYDVPVGGEWYYLATPYESASKTSDKI